MTFIRKEIKIMNIYSFIKILWEVKSNFFILNYRNLLKYITRKNATNNEDEDLIEDRDELMMNCQKELSNKKLNKQGLEKIISSFNKHLEGCSDRQKALEKRQEELERNSREYYIQNQKLICEIASRK